jgi:hypothetical protein
MRKSSKKFPGLFFDTLLFFDIQYTLHNALYQRGTPAFVSAFHTPPLCCGKVFTQP